MQKDGESPLNWIKRTWAFQCSNRGPIVRWRVEGRDSKDDKWRTVEQIDRPPTCNELTAIIDRAIANSDARRHRVQAWALGCRNQISTKSWPIEEENEDEEPSYSNPKNFLSQVYEYNKFLIHASSGAFMETFEAQRKTMLDMREELDKLRAREVEVFTLSQELQDRKVEREKGMLKAATLAKSIDAGIGMIHTKMLGAPQEGEAGNVLARTLRDFAGTLTTEQIEILKTALRPEQLVTFLGLMQDGNLEREDSDDPEPELPQS